MKKIFSVPSGITSNVSVIDVLTNLYHTRRDLFREDSEIGCIYDSFSGIWTGGRVFVRNNQSYDIIEETVDKFNSRGVPFRQIFSNLFIDDFLEDERCNKIMTILSKNKVNSVVISSDKALSVFKNKYPDLKYGSSVTKMLGSMPLFIEELRKDYDDVCLWLKFNNKANWEMIPQELRNKVSILICQNCNPNCAYSYICHMKFSVRTLQQYGVKIHEPYFNNRCTWKKPNTAEDLLNQSITLHHEDLDELVKMGINHFKITGRCGPINHMEMLKVFMYYLVDPNKYQEFVDVFEELYKPLSEKVEYTSTRHVTMAKAASMLELIDNTQDLPAEKLTNDIIEEADSSISNIVKGMSAREIRKNIVFLESHSICAVIIPKNNDNFTKQVALYEYLKYNKQNNDYLVVMTEYMGIIGSGQIETNYGVLDFLCLEPKDENSRAAYRTVLWNDRLVINLILAHQTLKSRFVNSSKVKAIINYISHYVDYSIIDVDWLNYAIVREVG